MNKNKEWEKNRRKLLNDYFVDVEPDNEAGEFIVDGVWYAPKFGCDTLDMVLDEVEYINSQAEDNMRKRCIEALPKERNLNTKFPTFGVNRENESWIRGFNVALNQATQNINNLDKGK